MLKMIFLIASLFLVGCATGLPTPPIKQVRMLDLTNSVCALYDITPTSGKPKYTLNKELPLKSCDGNVCLAPVDFKKMENWALNVRDDYTCKLKE